MCDGTQAMHCFLQVVDYVGIKLARKESLLWRRKWWCRTKARTPQEAFPSFRTDPYVLSLSFSPEAGAFLFAPMWAATGTVGKCPSKADLYAAQVSIGSAPMATKGHHVGNIGKEP